jgi:hypothetical protein
MLDARDILPQSSKVEYKPGTAYDLLFKVLDPQYPRALDTLGHYATDPRFLQALEGDIYRNTLDSFVRRLISGMPSYYHNQVESDKDISLSYRKSGKDDHDIGELLVGKAQLERYSRGVKILLESYLPSSGKQSVNPQEVVNTTLTLLGIFPFKDQKTILEVIDLGAKAKISDIDLVLLRAKFKPSGFRPVPPLSKPPAGVAYSAGSPLR